MEILGVVNVAVRTRREADRLGAGRTRSSVWAQACSRCRTAGGAGKKTGPERGGGAPRCWGSVAEPGRECECVRACVCVCVFACAYLCACAPVRAGGGGVQKGRDLLFPLAEVQVEMGSAAPHGSFRARGPAGPWSFVGAAGAERAVPGLSVPESGCACRRPAPRSAIAWCSALSRRLYISSISSLFFCLLLSLLVILFASPPHSQLKRKKKVSPSFQVPLGLE